MVEMSRLLRPKRTRHQRVEHIALSMIRSLLDSLTTGPERIQATAELGLKIRAILLNVRYPKRAR